ncbi:MAG: hypothetical protein M1823_004029 [Watsoniomyces obsoletus]|nr:MAG: hypothetical protein M1823_004029 [Watsoniomyces obsoletus]
MRLLVILSALVLSGALPALALPQERSARARFEDAAEKLRVGLRAVYLAKLGANVKENGIQQSDRDAKAANTFGTARKLRARQLYVDSPAVDIPEKLRILGELKETVDADLQAAQASGSEPDIAAATQQVQLVDEKIGRYSAPGANA